MFINQERLFKIGVSLSQQLVAYLYRVIPYAGIQHASYDYFKRGFMSYNSKRHASNTSGVEKESFVSSKLSHTQTIVAGSLAGGLSVLCTYPLDIVRARLVVQEGKLGRGGLMDAMVSMYRAGVSVQCYVRFKHIWLIVHAGYQTRLDRF